MLKCMPSNKYSVVYGQPTAALTAPKKPTRTLAKGSTVGVVDGKITHLTLFTWPIYHTDGGWYQPDREAMAAGAARANATYRDGAA